MSLLDDYIESSEAAHGVATVQFGADAFPSVNGFDGHDNVRVNNNNVLFATPKLKQAVL